MATHDRRQRGRSGSRRTGDPELRLLTGQAYPNWEAIYDDNVEWVYRLMYGKVGNQQDAEDLTAERHLPPWPSARN